MPNIDRNSIRPLSGYVFIEPFYEGSASTSIIIPDTSVEKHSSSGWIVATADSVYGLTPGDFVLFQPWKAVVIPLNDGATQLYREQLYVLSEEDIEAVLEW
jgi:co-chaperonin GroES (HSP10)